MVGRGAGDRTHELRLKTHELRLNAAVRRGEELHRAEIDFVPALSQSIVNSVQSAHSEEQQCLRRSSQRDHAQTPIGLVRPRLQPTGVHFAMLLANAFPVPRQVLDRGCLALMWTSHETTALRKLET